MNTYGLHNNRTTFKSAYMKRRAMSLDEAKSLLGFSSYENPTEMEVTKAYRAKAFEAHPDRGGSEDAMVQVNVARDVLTGRQRPTHGVSSPSTSYSSPERVRYEKPRTVEVTFAEAKGKAGIPADVEWKFVTDSQRGDGYSSDEFERYDNCRVAYGRTATKHVFVAFRHKVYRQMFIGAGADQDIWTIRSLEYPIKADEGTEPAWLYGNVVRALKAVYFEGKFNSKVLDAEGWRLDEDRMPHGTALSIKHWLANSGQVAGDDPRVVSRKNIVEITYSKSSMPMKEHYKADNRYDYEAVALVCNGNTEYLKERDLTRFVENGLVRKVFGEYTYGGEKKSLTRMREGKKFIEMFLTKFDLSERTRQVLTATLAQMNQQKTAAVGKVHPILKVFEATSKNLTKLANQAYKLEGSLQSNLRRHGHLMTVTQNVPVILEKRDEILSILQDILDQHTTIIGVLENFENDLQKFFHENAGSTAVKTAEEAFSKVQKSMPPYKAALRTFEELAHNDVQRERLNAPSKLYPHDYPQRFLMTVTEALRNFKFDLEQAASL